MTTPTRIKAICEEVFNNLEGYEYFKESEDYWRTPEEFEHEGGGDCEDWAIWWRSELIKCGVPVEKLWLTWIPWTPKESHIILLVEDGDVYWMMNILAYFIQDITLEDMLDLMGDKTWRMFNNKLCRQYGRAAREYPAQDIPQWADLLSRC